MDNPSNPKSSIISRSMNDSISDIIDSLVKNEKIPTEPPTVGDWVFLASLNEEMLSKELKLSNDRIGWMMTSQSILFGAFCIILINQDKSPKTARLLLNVIPFIASVIIIGAFIGVIAAQIVITHLEHERSLYQAILGRIYGFNIPDVGSRRIGRLKKTRMLGFAPFLIVTSILLLIWVIVLLARLNIAVKIGDF